MNETATIKAYDLKWCGNEPFKFKEKDDYYWKRYHVGSGWHCIDAYKVKAFITDRSDIEVNCDDYKDAVIATIKEMIPRVNCIWRSNGGKVQASTNMMTVHISADPCPWLENYKINLL